MCRWAAYLGEAVFLEDIVTAPCHSLIAQSHCAREAKSPTNGDGFGLAWYGDRPEPGLYRDILPAWSDPNLKSLCRQIKSRPVPRPCAGLDRRRHQPRQLPSFRLGRWSFMHNGQIGGFERIRRGLEASSRRPLPRVGTTDFELFFLLMIDEGLAPTLYWRWRGRRRGLSRRLRTPASSRAQADRSFTNGDCVLPCALQPTHLRRRSIPASAGGPGAAWCPSRSTGKAQLGRQCRRAASSR